MFDLHLAFRYAAARLTQTESRQVNRPLLRQPALSAQSEDRRVMIRTCSPERSPVEYTYPARRLERWPS